MRRRTPSLPNSWRWPTRLLLPSALALGLLWIASPLLHGQGNPARAQAYKRIQNLRIQQLCRQHLQLINLALTQYVADNDGRLPNLASPAKLRQQLTAYRISGGNLICPITNQDYRINKRLAGKKLKDVAAPEKTLILWSAKPLADGHYMALVANGQTRRLSAGELAKYRK